jgi:hypothetical protein
MGASQSYDLTKLAKGRYPCQRFDVIFLDKGQDPDRGRDILNSQS